MRIAIACLLTIIAPASLGAEEFRQFSVPPMDEKRLDGEVDWRPYGFLNLNVRLASPQPGKKLLCNVFLVTKQDLYVRSRRCIVLTEKPQTFRLDLSDLSPDWQCVNARRPFGRDAIRWVRRWGVTVFCAKECAGSIAIGEPQFEPASHRRLEIYDVAIPDETPLNRAIPVSFRLTGYDGNPYDLTSIRCSVSSLGLEFPAYLRQNFEEVTRPGTGKTFIQQKELPYWHAEITAGRLGEHDVSVSVETLTERLTEDLGTLRVVDRPGPDDEQIPASITSPTTTTDGVLAPKTFPCDRRIFEYSNGSWRDPEQGLVVEEYWSVPLDWTSEWGHYTGLGEFDQRIAWQFEQTLHNTSAKKKSPLLIFSEDELDNRGTFNWKDHPFSTPGGGHLRHPAEVFGDLRSIELVLNRASYMWNRFGSFDGISGFLIRNNRENSKAVKWTNIITRELTRRFPDARIYSENIGLPDRTRKRYLALHRSWRTDDRLSKTTRIRHDRVKREINLSARFPDPAAIVTGRILHWSGAESFYCDIYRSSQSDDDIHVACMVRTEPQTVFQSNLVPIPDNKEWNRVRFTISDLGKWKCMQNKLRKLSDLELLNIHEMALLFFCTEPMKADFRVRNCRLDWGLAVDEEKAPVLQITDLKENTQKVPLYSKFELTFDLNKIFNNPYDPNEIDVSIQFITPSSKVLTHPGFYYEPWELRMKRGHETPYRNGQPCWKTRLTPAEIGNYKWKLIAKTPSETDTVKGTFECTPSSSHGFVRVCRENTRWFEFSDGSFYYPIGLNLRSPGDALSAKLGNISRINSEWAERAGTRSYEKWFPLMEKSGQNFARMWMCPWWCTLEWSPDQGPYHGLGYYSQTNSARLDRIMELAEKHGIYINLETMNHGIISTSIDHDWENNPLNTDKPGGYLSFATDFLASERAQKSHRNKLRYTVARWGYSTAIAWWGVLTEAEWTEPYSRKWHYIGRWAPRNIRTPKPWVTHKYIRPLYDWISDTGGYIRGIDAHPHVVSVHFSNPKNGLGVWRRPHTDVVHNNAYTDFIPGLLPASDRLEGVVGALHSYSKYYSRYRQNKPLIVGEWGGSHDDNSERQVTTELHVGMWTMIVTECSGACGFWWWNMVDGKNLYPYFKAVAEFMKGEDRRSGKYSSRRGRLVRSPNNPSPPAARAAIICFDDDDLCGYVYNTKISKYKKRDFNAPCPESFDDDSFRESGAMYLDLPDGIEDGSYVLEYWNTFTGRVIDRRKVTVDADNRLVPLMSHRVDLAFKLKKRQ